MPTQALEPLARPIPSEAAIQLARHLSLIKGPGYNLDFSGKVNMVPMDQQNSGIANTKRVVVNVAWDLDRCLDSNPGTRTNYLTTYSSKCFLNAYLWAGENLQQARGAFHSDLHTYFFDREKERWTLFNENEVRVVRELYIEALNIDLNFQNKPIIKIDVELTINWAAIRDNLRFPR